MVTISSDEEDDGASSFNPEIASVTGGVGGRTSVGGSSAGGDSPSSSRSATPAGRRLESSLMDEVSWLDVSHVLFFPSFDFLLSALRFGIFLIKSILVSFFFSLVAFG